MAKILCVLYDDPVNGYPKSYARADLPKIDHYPGRQALPTPKAVSYTHLTLPSRAPGLKSIALGVGSVWPPG